MPSICCAVDCDNSKGKKIGLTFYNIPKNDGRRQRWIAAIKRDHWTPTEHSRLCAEHFISGKKSENPLHPDYVPSLFAYLTPEQRQKKVSSFRKFEQTQAVKRKRSAVHDVGMVAACDINSDPHTDHESPPVEENRGETADHSYCKESSYTSDTEPCTNEACQTTIKRLTEECGKLRAEVHQLREKVSQLSFSQEAFMNNDDMVQDLTGLPSYAKLMVVFTFVSGFLKVGPSPFQSLIMTLMRMRLNLPLLFFSYIFHVSTPTVSRIFNSTLDVLYGRLSTLIVWPPKEQIQISLPMCFRNSSFRNCTSIIDCFEIFIERPKNMRARAQTYSQYKHHNSAKYLISITPQGVISFVSNGWGGRTSDKHITENSGFLENLAPGDVVLADRGFTVGDAVGLYSAHLKIPAFTKGKQQLHPSELEDSRGLAAVRIHVERVIGLVRNKYTILQSTIPISLCQTSTAGNLTSLDKMVRVCCALCNICPSVVPSE